MSEIQWESGPAGVLAGQWEELSGLMADAVRELDGGQVSGLAPDVQGAARAFLTAWSGYAGESREIADGFVEALNASAADYSGTDQGQVEEFGNLDGRLGPAR